MSRKSFRLRRRNGWAKKFSKSAPLKLSNWGTAVEEEKQIKATDWLWQRWIPKGYVTIVGGASGVGKGAFVLWLCRSVTMGTPWPDEQPGPKKTGVVIWCEAESGHAVNAERRKAFGIPSEMIIPAGGPLHDFRLDNPKEVRVLRRAVKKFSPKLVVLDSLGGSNRKDENSKTTSGMLFDLAKIAQRYNIPIVVTHHTRKTPVGMIRDSIGADEMRGSSAIVQPARSIIALDVPNPDEDKEHVRVAHVKSNLGHREKPFGMRWKNDCLVFDENAPTPPAKHTQSNIARRVIMKLLGDGKPHKQRWILRQLEASGVGEEIAKKVSTGLPIHKVPRKKNGKKSWVWQLKRKAKKS